jgi:LemA protein
MNALITVTLSITVTVGVTTAYTVGTYNTLIAAKNEVQQMWSNIKTEYQRRADLILNLVETTKGYKKHEKETLTQVTMARNGRFGKTQKQQIDSLKGLDKMFAKLIATIEAYPDLKANEQHNILMEELRNTENRVSVARVEYNQTVYNYNTYKQGFPVNIISNMFNFQNQIMYENEEITEKAPKIQLD